MQIRERWQAWTRRQRLAAVAGVLYAAYALAGYLLVSPLVHDRLVAELSSATGREVTLGDFVFNPVGLAVTATDFRLLDEDGTAFVSFDELYVDFELSSLLRWSWYFDVIELSRPQLQITQTGARNFNFDDLLAGDGDKDAGQEDAPTSLPRISIGELLLVDGDFRFRDRTRGELQELVLDDLDFEVLDFSTRGDGDKGNQYALAIAGPDGGRFDWTGRLSIEPLLLDGELSLAGLALAPFAEFYQDRLRFRLPEGELDIATRYRLDLSQDTPRLQTSSGKVTVSDLVIRQPEQDDETLALSQLVLEGIALDTAGKTVSAAGLEVETLSLLARLTPAGLDLASLFGLEPVSAPGSLEAADTADAGQAADKPAAPAEVENEAGAPDEDREGPHWRASLERLVVSGSTVTLRDESLDEPADLTLDEIALELGNLVWGEAGDFSLDGSANLEDGGALSLSGTGALAPLALDLALGTESLSLLPMEPWLRGQARLDLVGGSASLDVSVSLAQQDGSPATRIGVSGSINELALEELDGQPLLSMRALSLDDLAVDLGARRLSATGLTADGLRLSSRVDEQGRHVADRIVIPVEAPVAVGKQPAWQVQVPLIRLSDSELQFTDRSLASPFSIGLYRINAELSNLDSTTRAPSRLALDADVDRYAPLSVSGELKLMADDPFGDLQIDLKHYEMTSLTPYTGRYIGYTVSSGQLDMNTRLTLTGTLLDSMTRLRADSFYLGDSVDSDEAIKAPIKLGLAVLRDKSGIITLPVKAKGDLSDPSVSVSGIILKALGNVLVKAATSPFSVLASLAGGESLENLVFEPGSAEIDPALREDVASLALILEDRPSLELLLAGATSAEDRVALARADLLEQVWRDTVWPGVEQALPDERFRRQVRREFNRRTGQEAEQLVPATDGDEAAEEQRQRDIARQAWERLLAQGQAAIETSRLDALASDRASNVKALLVEQFSVAGSRVFLQAEPLADRKPVSGVQLSLDLD